MWKQIPLKNENSNYLSLNLRELKNPKFSCDGLISIELSSRRLFNYTPISQEGPLRLTTRILRRVNLIPEDLTKGHLFSLDIEPILTNHVCIVCVLCLSAPIFITIYSIYPPILSSSTLLLSWNHLTITLLLPVNHLLANLQHLLPINKSQNPSP